MAEQQLWKRVNESYTVEMLVGEVWVRHNSEPYSELSKAEIEAERQSRVAGVKEVRVCSLRTVQTYVELQRLQGVPSLVSAAKGFEPTGTVHACRLCHTDQPVAVDAQGSKWVFCGPCSRTIPI